jgi:hypothetical protein
LEVTICGVTFKKVNDNVIAIYHDSVFFKNIEYPAVTEEQFNNSANFYFIHCY